MFGNIFNPSRFELLLSIQGGNTPASVAKSEDIRALLVIAWHIASPDPPDQQRRVAQEV